jgi:hypothetical protein
MEPGIRGKAPFIGTPTPNLCPGCGDRLFSVEPGFLACELCGVEVRVAEAASLELQEGWGGQDLVKAKTAKPSGAPAVFRRQRRKTGTVLV